MIDRDVDPERVIDTTAIKTLHDAKEGPPSCTHNAPGIDMCEIKISSNATSYKGDYCMLCPDAHGCDATCGSPCGNTVPTPPPLQVVCDTDASEDLCRLLLSTGTKTCKDFLCFV